MIQAIITLLAVIIVVGWIVEILTRTRRKETAHDRRLRVIALIYVAGIVTLLVGSAWATLILIFRR